jgi:P-type Ca2+ transporter type 2C
MLDSTEVLQQLNTNVAAGLSQSEVTNRLKQHGANKLTEQPGESLWQILWKQLTATMVVVLIVAALISIALHDYTNAIAIFAIVAFNAILGVRQEYQARQAIAALKKLAVSTVKVRRDQKVQEISARQLVPGDIVLLETGNLVAADYRLLESINLRIQESSLTGESEPTGKDAEKLELGDESSGDRPKADPALADRHNMAYMGTVITYGRGLAVVTATGDDTELGHIATAIQTVRPKPTPLQKRLDQLGTRLAIITLILVAVIFGLGLLRGEELSLMFLTAVSLAVAAVPEGLPAVVTIALALGAQRMLKQHALIRKLPAVETLGSVTVICSDKTGTLTENRMTATFLAVADHRVDLTTPQHRAAMNTYEDSSGLLEEQPTLAWLLTGAALCNDALLEPHPAIPHQFHTVGDPTEGALVMTAAHLGLWKANLEKALPRIAEKPFEATRKRMTTVHTLPVPTATIPEALKRVVSECLNLGAAAGIAFTKGSVGSLLEVSSHVWAHGKAESLDERWHEKIFADNDQLARNGMRVLGIAFHPLDAQMLEADGDTLVGETLERNLIFIGMVGLIDPIRPEVKDAVLMCQEAGIRPVMITGDHPLTAQFIARELGIVPNDRILTGQALSQLSSEDLKHQVEAISVYARVSPQNKLDIVQALQHQGHIVAMTGDGVNDAPALKQADIGIAMGITGTDVAKDAGDMVLLDDNFATIISTIKEGRAIYDNIRKFIKYTLTGNAGELWVILLAPFFGMPLPLIPLQILWVNLLADGLLALALSVEPAERKVMRRPPRPPNESVFSRGVGRGIAWIGLLLGLILLAIAYHYWSTGQANWQTMVFTTLALSRVGMAETMRSERDSLFRLGLFSNKPLLAAVVLTIGLQLAVIYIPLLQTVFQTIALSPIELLISVLLSTLTFWAIELEKWFTWRQSKQVSRSKMQG